MFIPTQHLAGEIERMERMTPAGRRLNRPNWRWIAGRRFREDRWN